MSELREVFEMTTDHMEPDVDSWQDQQRRQRETARNRKLGAYSVAVAIAVVAALVAVRAVDEERTQTPANAPAPPLEPPIGELQNDVFLDLGTGEVTPLPESIRSIDNVRGYQVSPDGTRLAFAAGRPGGWIYVANVDGTDVRRVTSLDQAFNPRWSPDGTKIVFEGGPLLGDAHIYVVDLATGQTTRLTSDREDEDRPTFSPDGRTILYTTESRLRTVPATGGESSLLIEDAAFGSYSPDGRTIAYLHNVIAPQGTFPGGGEIWLADADGGGGRRLLVESSQLHLAWSPDGTRIAYQPVSGGLATVDVATGAVTKVAMTSGQEPVWLDDNTLIIEDYQAGGLG
jgi:Tol biopolymer transport system component